MSNQLVEIKTVTRRDAVRAFALALTTTGLFDYAQAQHVHAAAAVVKGADGKPYKPKGLTQHEFGTITRMAEMIMPADDLSGSAVDAGAPQFIDTLCAQNKEIANIFRGGILWVDNYMLEHEGTRFLAASEGQQTAMLDTLDAASHGMREPLVTYSPSDSNRGFRKYRATNMTPLAPGARFFDWCARMTVDAFYTSPMGQKDVQYKGSQAVSEYKVPDEVIDYLKNNGSLA